MANEFKIRKGLIVTGASGGTVVDIQGSQGQLFSVTDDLSGDIFAVSDISGVPIFTVNSSSLSTFDGLVSGITPVNAANFVTKAYVDGSGGGTGPFLPLAGGTLTGSLTGTSATFTGKVITTELESTGALLLDAVGDITIDAGGGDIILSDDATIFGTISSSGGMQIRSRVNNADMFFRGVDDGTEFNALTLDMSEGGNATFAGNITVGDGHFIGDDSFDNLLLQSSSGENLILSSANDLIFYTGGSSPTSYGTQRLRIFNSDGSAEFAGSIKISDNQKIILGDNPDLEIYHNSANSYIETTVGSAGDFYIKAQGTNHDLYLEAADDIYIRPQSGESGIDVIGNAEVNLYYDSGLKLSTLSTSVGTATNLGGTLVDGWITTTQANAIDNTTIATTAYVNNKIALIPAGLVFQGTWDARTQAEGGAAGNKGNPALTSGVGTTGNFYIVSNSGSVNLDNITDWKVGDWAVFIEQGASDEWEKIDNSSVLDGIGTGGTMTAWAGSGTSNTLTDSPVTFTSAKVEIPRNVEVITSGYPYIDLGVSSSNYFRIIHDNPTDILKIGKNGAFTASSVIINPSGNVGIGTVPGQKLHSYIATGDIYNLIETGSNVSTAGSRYKSSAKEYFAGLQYNVNAAYQIYDITGGAARMTISSDGQIIFPRTGQPPITNSLYGNIVLDSNAESNFQRIRYDVGTTPYWGLTRLNTGNFAITGTSTWNDHIFEIGYTTGNISLGQIPRTIGTYKVLDISGSGTAGGYIGFNNGTTGQAEIYSNSSSFEFVAIGAKTMRFYNNGVERMKIQSNGQVNISQKPNSGLTYDVLINLGTSPDGLIGYQTQSQLAANLAVNSSSNWVKSGNDIYNTNSANVGIGVTGPGEKLEIDGNIRIHNSSNAPYIDFTESGATSDSKARITMDQIDTDNGTLIFGTENAGTLFSQMKLTETGNLAFSNDAAGFNTSNAKLNIQPASNGVYTQWNYSNTNETFALKLKETVTSGNVRYVFEQNNNGTTYSNVLVFNQGNVGIGTDSPGTAKLFVQNPNASTNPVFQTKLDTAYGMGMTNQWVSTYVSKIQLGRLGGSAVSNIDFIYDIAGTEYGSIKRNYIVSSLKFERGTTLDMIIDGSGNVGIDVSAPDSYNSSAKKLVVGGSGDTGITISTSSTNMGTLMFADGTGGTAGYRGRVSYDHDGDYMRFDTSATEKMRIDSAGSTTITTDGTVDATTLTLTQTGGIVIDEALGYLNFYSNDPSTSSTGGVGGIAVRAETAFNTSFTPTYMSFYTHILTTNDGTVRGNVTERMRINSAGNVGIGVSNPETSRLLVRGSTNDSTSQIFQAASLSGATRYAIRPDGDNKWYKSDNSLSMTLTSTGDVGINTTSPDFKLDVAGTLGVSDLPGNVSSTSVLVRNETIGAELLLNPDFATNTIWGGSASIANGQLTKTGGGLAYQTITGLVSGATYLIEVDVASIAGTANFYLGGTNSSALVVGKQSFYLLGGSANLLVGFNNGYSGSTGSAFNSVSLKLVTSASNQIQTKQISSGAFDDTWAVTPTDSSNIYNLNSGNVGIGTSTPLAKLDIQGTQGQLFSVTDDLSGSIFAVADISGVPIFDVNSSGVSYFDGNVGIGTDSPGAKLEVKSSANLNSFVNINTTTDAYDSGISLRQSSNYGFDVYYTDDGVSPSVRGLYFDRVNNGSVANAMFIDRNSGNVGIGTTSVYSKLGIAASSHTNGFSINRAANTTACLYIGNDGNSTPRIAANNTDLTFGMDVSGAWTEWLRITGTGKIGIRTTTPVGQLSLLNQINGGTNPVSSYATTYPATTNNQSFFNTYYVSASDGYGTFPRYLDIVCNGSPNGSTGGSNIRFFTNPITNQAPTVERMRIDSSGNVGIGTDSPQYKLQVEGDMLVARDINLSSRARIVLDDEPFADPSAGSGTIVKWSVSSATTAGLLYILKFNGSWTAADADFELKSTGMVAISLGADADEGMLLQGFFYKSAHGFTIGLPLYISNTEGAFTNTRPTGSNDYVRVIGYATSANHIYFDPDKTWVQVV